MLGKILLPLFLSFAPQDPTLEPASEGALVQRGTGEDAALRQGKKAMAAGRSQLAAAHFLFALSRTENPLSIMRLLFENSAGDADAEALWALDLGRQLVDSKGRISWPKFSKGTREKNAELFQAVEDLMRSRAVAIRQLKRHIKKRSKAKKSGARIEQEWLEDFGRVLAGNCPALQKEVRSFTAIIESERSIWYPVVDALVLAANSAANNNRVEDAIKVGRCLVGMTAQSRMGKDLKGPEAISMDRGSKAAGAALSRARGFLERNPDAETSIEALEFLDEDQRRALTLDNASFGHPSRCPSPRNWYMVETSCGWETIHGTATTVEYHHTRLANWFGQDPFVGNRGMVRIVPESHGLEAEGGSMWWAGGFQGGDTTVLKFTMGTIPGLGRGLTHELTHRFDGAIYPGMPGWLVEGKATWTAGAYGSMKETNFVENHCSPGTMRGTRNMGYGEFGELEKLVGGTVEEYRDYYTAGYGLFVYLKTATGQERLPKRDEDGNILPGEIPESDGPPIYYDQLQRFMETRRSARGNAVSEFEKYFADGKDGRPSGLRDFAKKFDEYLLGFNTTNTGWWTKRYTTAVPGSDPAPRVYDEPTWTWLRNRAEPWFGQVHSRMAGDFFLAKGKAKEAVAAYTWALAVDEPSIATMDHLAEALEEVDNPDGAWMVRHWPRFLPTGARVRLGAQALASTQAPFVSFLDDTQTVLEAYQRVQSKWLSEGKVQAARAVFADYQELGSWLGISDLAKQDFPENKIGVDEAGALNDEALHPFAEPWRLMTFDGWGEEDLTGYEDNRVPGLWVEDATKTMHVGRKKVRSGTGTKDRTSHYRDAFVLSKRWVDPGRYRFRAQIESTTAFLNGGIVFGWSRRDRNVRFGFSQGDWDFAIGKEESGDGAKKLNWSLNGLYARRGAQSGAYSFRGERKFFVVDIEVDGPTAEVYLDGKSYATFSTLDGSAIHGRIGFYTSRGAMKVSHPELRRLDRLRFEPGARAVGAGLHPNQSGDLQWRFMLGRPVSGLPLADSGTVLVWHPEQTEAKRKEMEDGEWYDRVADSLDLLLDGLESEYPSQGLLVLVPPSFPEEAIGFLKEDFADVLPGGFDVMLHSQPRGFEEDQRTIGGWTSPVLAFVDPTGFLRYSRRLTRFTATLPVDFRNLLRELQDHSRPGLAGASD